MEKIQILAIGRDPVVLQKLLRFINENPAWEVTGTIDDNTALIIFKQRKYDIVLLIDNLSRESEGIFRTVFTDNNPNLILIRHYGDSTGLLASEIQEAISVSRI